MLVVEQRRLLEALLRERGTGAGYVQQVMSVPLADAQAIHDELLR